MRVRSAFRVRPREARPGRESRVDNMRFVAATWKGAQQYQGGARNALPASAARRDRDANVSGHRPPGKPGISCAPAPKNRSTCRFAAPGPLGSRFIGDRHFRLQRRSADTGHYSHRSARRIAPQIVYVNQRNAKTSVRDVAQWAPRIASMPLPCRAAARRLPLSQGRRHARIPMDRISRRPATSGPWQGHGHSLAPARMPRARPGDDEAKCGLCGRPSGPSGRGMSLARSPRS
jgi:hypothetical protein